MAKKRKKYLVTKDSEALKCSLVTSPAMESDFVAFNEETPLVEKFADEKKHMITGVVAIPNKPIFRRNADGEEYDLIFSEEAIEHMAKSYLKNYRNNDVTLQHQEDTDGVFLVEQWIKNDMVYDKSISLGLSKELPIGSWFQTYYVDSNDVWKRIEEGELRGFSLEATVGLEEFEKQDNNMNIETNDMGFWNKMKSILQEVFTSTALAKQDPPLDEGTEINQEVEEAKLEKVTMEEETPPTEPNPEHTEAVEEVKVEDTKEEQTETNPEPTEEPKPNPLEELVKTLTEEIKALKESNEGLNKKIKELNKQPSAKPISTVGGKGNGGDTYANWRETMRSLIG